MFPKREDLLSQLNDEPDYKLFLEYYFKNYPERPLLRLKAQDKVKVRWGKDKCDGEVLEVDATLAKIRIKPQDRIPKVEWIYRGSLRLDQIYMQLKPLLKLSDSITSKRFGASSQSQVVNRPIRYLGAPQSLKRNIEWESESKENEAAKFIKTEPKTQVPAKDVRPKSDIISIQKPATKLFQQQIRRNLYKHLYNPSDSKLLTKKYKDMNSNLDFGIDNSESNVTLAEVCVPINVKRQPLLFVEHTCSSVCLRLKNPDEESDRHYKNINLFTVPYILGWNFQICSMESSNEETKRKVHISAPCGRKLRNISEVRNFLIMTGSKLDVDQFTFTPEFRLYRPSPPVKAHYYNSDISNGK